MMGLLRVKAVADSSAVAASVDIAEYGWLGPFTTPFEIQLPVGTVTLLADYDNQHKEMTASIKNQEVTEKTFEFIKPSPIYYPVKVHYYLEKCCRGLCNCEFSGEFACVFLDGVKRGNVPWSGQLQNREYDLCLGGWLGSFHRTDCHYDVISGSCSIGWNGRLGCSTDPCRITSPPVAVDRISGKTLPKHYHDNVPHWTFTPKAEMDIWVVTVGY